MGIFVNYPSNIFSGLIDKHTTIITADTNVIQVKDILVCNRTAAPVRFNLQQSRIQGVTLEKICNGASTTNFNVIYNNGTSGLGATLTNNDVLAPFFVDGLTPALNDRILIKDQTNTFQNGIYTVSTIGSISVPWVLTRATDFDSVLEIKNGDAVSVTTGTINANTKWLQNSNVTVVGTSPITFIVNVPYVIYLVNQLEIAPYASIDVIDTIGVCNLMYSVTPYISDSLICFSNGYTQEFDCRISYEQLNELPLS